MDRGWLQVGIMSPGCSLFVQIASVVEDWLGACVVSWVCVVDVVQSEALWISQGCVELEVRINRSSACSVLL